MRAWRLGGRLVLVGVLLLAGAGLARAQSGTAGLRGTVADAQGAHIPGATVTLTNNAAGLSRETVTDASGDFLFVAMPPGTYALKVELQGFRTAIVDSVPLAVDTVARQDVKLEIGTITETVQVTAETRAVNTTDASLGNVISGKQLDALPLEARNVAGALSLQAGVVYVPAFFEDDPRSGAVSGARADQSNVTLDGVDVNDAETQALGSVLRVPLDSLQEFRVTTSNYGADQGRSSGAQVSLVTKSGTNSVNGAGYLLRRDTATSSNEYFLKLSQLQAGEPSETPKLDKTIWGGSIGGPVLKDKLFFFLNYERLDESRENSVFRNIPSASLRDGVLIYPCDDPGQCPGGSVQGLHNTHSVPGGYFGLSPDDLRRIDPLHIGPSLAASEYFNQYPLPNDPGADRYNLAGFRFAAPIENLFNTYFGRVDYRLNANQTLFARFGFQDDEENAEPTYPGKPPVTALTVKNRGLAVGYDVVLSANTINTFRYGYTLVDRDKIGIVDSSFTTFRFLDGLDETFNAQGTGDYSSGRETATHNIINDFTWLKGDHTLKFGTNLRWVRNDRYSFENSFHVGVANGSWVSGVGRTYMPGGECPPPGDCSGLPAVAEGGQSSYADSLIDVLGIISEVDAYWNYTIDGQLLPVGEPTMRLWAADEYEFYAQDSWKLGENFTVTGGLRYSLFSPPYEANGVQVAPLFSLGEWFEQRRANAAAGIPSNASPRATFVPAGPKNDRRGFYDWDYNNFAPRASFAWTPKAEDGVLGWLTGKDRMVIRGGYSMVYDRIGAGLALTFDQAGSFGLSTLLASPFGQNNEDNPDIRFEGADALPPTLPAAPPGGFPATPEVGIGQITEAIDDQMTTPYSHVFNFVVSRDLGRDFAIEGGYVGRRGRDLLIRRDLAMPLNLVDPGSGADYFTAARALIGATRGISPSADLDAYAGVGPIAYWENIFPDAGAVYEGFSATQVMGWYYNSIGPDYITALWLADQFCDPACSKFGPFAYFAEQWDALAAQSSIARADYDAMQLTFRKRFSHGYSFDVNYTLSKAKDHGSAVERTATFSGDYGGGYTGFLINSWEPDLSYSYADFDVRHQLNVNWLTELPFGRGKAMGTDAPGWLNAMIGDWAVAGIWRWTSGFPFNVINCRSCWPTNWNLQGNAELVDPSRPPETETTKDVIDGYPSPFANPQEALEAFRRALPGEIGLRNMLRGDGYFAIDLSVSKAFHLPFGHALRFRWDTFNLTNTPRFDTNQLTALPDRASTFGRYDGTLATCDRAAGRCMQFALRYEF